MVSERDAELYRKIRAYNMQFINYILKKAKHISKVELAIETLVVVNLYQAMALVIAPKCPEEYQAQVDALKATLDKVFEYLHSDRYDKETESQLESEVIEARKNEFIKFMGSCAGLEVKMEEKPDMINELPGVFRTPEGKYYWMEVKVKAPPQIPPSPPSPKAIAQAQELAGALGSYHSQLVEYILQKTNRDKSVPLALMGLEMSYLNNNVGFMFLFMEPPNMCQAIFTGQVLENVVDDLKDLVRAINETRHEELNLGTIFELFDTAHHYIHWRSAFLTAVASCYLVDIGLVPVPKGNSIELAIVKYEPVRPGTESGTEQGSTATGSQEGGEGHGREG